MPKKQLGKAKPRKWKPKTATSIAIKFQEASDRAQCRYEQMTKDLFDSRQKIARLTEERDGLKRRIDSGYINDNLRFDSHSNSIVRYDGLKITSEFINCCDFRRMEDLASSAASWEAKAKTSEIAEAIWKSTHEDEEQYGKELELFIAALCRNLEIANNRWQMMIDHLDDSQWMQLALEYEQKLRAMATKLAESKLTEVLALRKECERQGTERDKLEAELISVRGKIAELESELEKYKPDRTICQMEVVKA